MPTLQYFSKPYELQQLLTALGGEQQQSLTVQEALDAVNADISTKLPYVCPNCATTGRIPSGQTTIECPTCYGYGNTAEQISTVRTFSPTATQPTEPTL